MYEVEFNDKKIIIETNVSLFSPTGPDKGTLSMLRHVEFAPDDKILDLGCGTGIVSLAACAYGVNPVNVVLTDIDALAVKTANSNMTSNGFEGAAFVCGDGLSAVTDSGFDKILSNPPYHTDFKIAKAFIEKGFNRLKVGGKFYMVTKRKDWYKNKLISIFGGVKIYEEDGYFVFESIKKSDKYADKKPLKTKSTSNKARKK